MNDLVLATGVDVDDILKDSVVLSNDEFVWDMDMLDVLFRLKSGCNLTIFDGSSSGIKYVTNVPGFPVN